MKSSEPIAFQKPRKSLPQMYNISPENFTSGKLVKEGSTSTLVATESSEGTPPSATGKISEETSDKNTSDDTDVSSIHSSPSPAKPAEMTQLQKRLFSKLRPTRTVSLHLTESKKDEEVVGLSGLQKFYRRRRSSHNFPRVSSQPVSPTEAKSPSIGIPSRGGIHSRRLSKEERAVEKSPKVLHSQDKPQIVVSTQDIVEEKNLKNKKMSEV